MIVSIATGFTRARLVELDAEGQHIESFDTNYDCLLRVLRHDTATATEGALYVVAALAERVLRIAITQNR